MTTRLLSILLGGFAFVALADAPAFKGGHWKTFVYDHPDTTPIVFGGESRSEAACAPDYCIYLDIWHPDGSNTWAVRSEWNQGTHGWERIAGAHVPSKPISKIQMFAFLRKGTGKAEFRDLWLERREGRGDRMNESRRTLRPFRDEDRVSWESFEGRKVVRRQESVPPAAPAAVPPGIAPDGFAVWTADSMQRVTPLTFPTDAVRAAPCAVELELAGRERESFQVEVTCGANRAWTNGIVRLPVLRTASGEPLRGEISWQRVGYVARETGYDPHPLGVDPAETWLPDPLLPPAPFRVRKASTQGLWFTVHAAADAQPGVYAGDIVVEENGVARATVHVAARVRAFAQPATFGMPTAFCVMDGFTRAQYGAARLKAMKRASWDVMLDHRLNPDDISRTTPPEIEDLLHARARGMNRFNILNIVPPPSDPNATWVCYTPPEATFNPQFYPAFKARLAPYVAELRRQGLLPYAYLYGFDERREDYYEGIDRLWRQLKADFPEIPVLTTALMYADRVRGSKNPYLETTDWFCPITSTYRPELSAELRAKGKQVWWYTCCGPRYPYANMASLEYPPVEGRLLGWMTHLYRSDGLLYWHVNYWGKNPCLAEDDTYFPDWHTHSSLRMPGDGIFLYPGREHILPSIRLAQVRDGVEDYEWLQLATKRAGAAAADAVSRRLVTSMKEYVRDPAALRRARSALAARIEAARVTVDFAQPVGRIKPMHGVGQPPQIGWDCKMFHYLKEAGIPFSRLHDVGGAYGRNAYVDIPNIFRDFDADENDPKNYDFAFTDYLLKNLVANGVEPFYRLGITIENRVDIHALRTAPPKDFAKWARICEHVIRHYTEGWANGFNYTIRYWEIWNEPESPMDKPHNGSMWSGSWRQYMELYEVTSKHLKKCFPHLKIGGYASCGFAGGGKEPGTKRTDKCPPRYLVWIDCYLAFLKHVKERNCPLDFFSFHTYADVNDALRQVNWGIDTLHQNGFTNVETTLNEWLPRPTHERLGSASQAADVCAEMIGLQHTKLDSAMIYDARCGTGNYSPLFNPMTYRPHKAYYALKAFNELYRLGTEVKSVSPEKNVWVVAAGGAEGGCVLIANTSRNPVPFTPDFGRRTIAGCVLTDANHTNEEVPLPGELPPESFLLLRVK